MNDFTSYRKTLKERVTHAGAKDLFIGEPEDLYQTVEYNRLLKILKADGISTKYFDDDMDIGTDGAKILKSKWKLVNAKKKRYSKKGLIVQFWGSDEVKIELYAPSYADKLPDEQ